MDKRESIVIGKQIKLARMLAQTNRSSEARALCEEILNEEPEHFGAIKLLSSLVAVEQHDTYVSKIRACLSKGDYEGPLAIIRSLLAQKNLFWGRELARTALLAVRNLDSPQALPLLQALAERSKIPEVRFALAEMLIMSARNEADSFSSRISAALGPYGKEHRGIKLLFDAYCRDGNTKKAEEVSWQAAENPLHFEFAHEAVTKLLHFRNASTMERRYAVDKLCAIRALHEGTSEEWRLELLASAGLYDDLFVESLRCYRPISDSKANLRFLGIAALEKGFGSAALRLLRGSLLAGANTEDLALIVALSRLARLAAIAIPDDLPDKNHMQKLFNQEASDPLPPIGTAVQMAVKCAQVRPRAFDHRDKSVLASLRIGPGEVQRETSYADLVLDMHSKFKARVEVRITRERNPGPSQSFCEKRSQEGAVPVEPLVNCHWFIALRDLAANDPQMRDIADLVNCWPSKERVIIAEMVLCFLDERPEKVHVTADETNGAVAVSAILAGVPQVVLLAANDSIPLRDEYRPLLSQPNVSLAIDFSARAPDHPDWLGNPA